jgi:hypothetical protein
LLTEVGSDGKVVWAKQFGGTAREIPLDVGFDPLTGRYCLTGTYDLDTAAVGNVAGALPKSKGSFDSFVVVLSSAGARVGGVTFGGTGADRANSCAFDATGRLLVAGRYTGPSDFGGGVMLAAPAGAGDAFLLVFDSTGTPVKAKPYGGTSDDEANSILVGGSKIYFAGLFSAGADFGGGSPLAASEGLVAVLDTSIAYLDTIPIPATSVANPRWMAPAAGGDLVVGGEFSGSLTATTPTLASSGSVDAFALRIAPVSKAVRWAHRWGGSSADYSFAGTISSSDSVGVAGSVSGAVSFDVTTTTKGGSDGFYLRLSP